MFIYSAERYICIPLSYCMYIPVKVRRVSTCVPPHPSELQSRASVQEREGERASSSLSVWLSCTQDIEVSKRERKRGSRNKRTTKQKGEKTRANQYIHKMGVRERTLLATDDVARFYTRRHNNNLPHVYIPHTSPFFNISLALSQESVAEANKK